MEGVFLTCNIEQNRERGVPVLPVRGIMVGCAQKRSSQQGGSGLLHFDPNPFRPGGNKLAGLCALVLLVNRLTLSATVKGNRKSGVCLLSLLEFACV